MFLQRRTPQLPTPEEALKGRPTPEFTVPSTHTVLGNPLEGPYPEGLEVADFALGCFWGAERKFWQTDGVWTTLAGYQGGYTENPAYEEVCSGLTGHTEAVRVVFDPKTVSYAELLKLFWESHDPTQGFRQGNDVGTQYRSAIYTHSPAQEAAVAASRDAYQKVLTAMRPLHDHHGDPPGGGPHVLARGGLPPAVPRQEPGGLLRHRRHGRLVPDRGGSGGGVSLAAAPMAWVRPGRVRRARLREGLRRRTPRPRP